MIPPLAGLWRFLAVNLAPGEARIRALQRLLYTPGFLARVDRDRLAQRMEDQLAGRPARHTRLAHLRAIARHHTLDRLHQIEAPTLVIGARDDLLVRPTQTQLLADQIPGARQLWLDDAGHGLTFERAPEINRALLEHFEAAERARLT